MRTMERPSAMSSQSSASGCKVVFSVCKEGHKVPSVEHSTLLHGNYTGAEVSTAAFHRSIHWICCAISSSSPKRIFFETWVSRLIKGGALGLGGRFQTVA